MTRRGPSCDPRAALHARQRNATKKVSPRGPASDRATQPRPELKLFAGQLYLTRRAKMRAACLLRQGAHSSHVKSRRRKALALAGRRASNAAAPRLKNATPKAFTLRAECKRFRRSIFAAGAHCYARQRRILRRRKPRRADRAQFVQQRRAKRGKSGPLLRRGPRTSHFATPHGKILPPSPAGDRRATRPRPG